MLGANEDFETEPDAERASHLNITKNLYGESYFGAGRRRRERSILHVCEHPDFKPDAERASQDKFLEVEEVLSVIITNILNHLAQELYLACGQKTGLDIGTD